MKIKRLEVKNYIGIDEKAIDVGRINYLKGHKGSGKTSIVEAIEKALTNKDRRTEVIRHGEDEAVIFLQLDDGLEIDRKIRTQKADYLKISRPGEPVPQTEKYLRQFIEGDIFRPLEFVNQKPEEQAKILLDMLKIEWSPDDIINWFGEKPEDINYHQHVLKILKQIENKYYAERETVNREANVLEIQVKAIKNELPKNYNAELWRDKKVQDYYLKVAQAEEINKKIAAAKNIIEGLEIKISGIKSAVEVKKKEIKEGYDEKRKALNIEINTLTNLISSHQDFLDKSEDRIKGKTDELNAALEIEIERIKAAHESKKVAEIQILKDMDAKTAARIACCNSEITQKDSEIKNIDEVEKLSLDNLEKLMAEKIESEKSKAGDAEIIVRNSKEIDVEPLTQEANEVADMQSYLREYDRMEDIIRDKLAPRQEKSAALTEKIQTARALPMELLKTANVPVPGMEVDDNGFIRVNGVLIDGLSEGEQLELAFSVAKARTGDLKVICLDGINKINPADREFIAKGMEDPEYQYFVIETTDGDLTIEAHE